MVDLNIHLADKNVAAINQMADQIINKSGVDDQVFRYADNVAFIGNQIDKLLIALQDNPTKGNQKLVERLIKLILVQNKQSMTQYLTEQNLKIAIDNMQIPIIVED